MDESKSIAKPLTLRVHEVFMFICGPYAEAENHSRANMPGNDFYRVALDGSTRPWGGLNLTIFGNWGRTQRQAARHRQAQNTPAARKSCALAALTFYQQVWLDRMLTGGL